MIQSWLQSNSEVGLKEARAQICNAVYSKIVLCATCSTGTQNNSVESHRYVFKFLNVLYGDAGSSIMYRARLDVY